MGLAFFVLAAVLLALGAWFWSAQTVGSAVSADGRQPVRASLHVETFLINLTDHHQRSYLRVGVDLGLGREIGKGESPTPIGEVRDTILGVLAQARVEELLTAAGRRR